MQKFTSQILGGTRLDRQGERVPKEALLKFCETYSGRKMPLGVQHSVQHEPVGYVENMRVEESTSHPGEWTLVGDVTITEGDLDTALRGFSISYTEIIRAVEEPSLLIYLPYPAYNNETLLNELKSDGELSVGKWVRKDADPLLVAIVVMAMGVVVQPLWNQFYNEKIAPSVSRFLHSHRESLSRNGIGFHLVQKIFLNNQLVELRFVPSSAVEVDFFTHEAVERGIYCAIAFVENHKDGEKICRLVLEYDPIGREFYVARHDLEM